MTDRMFATIRQAEIETTLVIGGAFSFVASEVDERAGLIYDAVFDGYYRLPWAYASPMDRFRCQRAVVALERLQPESRAA